MAKSIKKNSETIEEKNPPISKGKAKRVPTGIPNFDHLIMGGFENKSVNLVVGGSGSAKSIFATQFIINGMKTGDKCLYVTFEENKEEFYSNMLEFGWDLTKYERRGLFTFLEYTPLKVKMMLEEGGGDIESIILKEKITRIVIDSITSFALLFEDELSKREAAMTLFNMIRRWNCTSLLTLEEEPLSKEKTGSKSLEFEVDSIILLYFVRNKNKRERYIEILKMRGTAHSRNIYRFDVNENGVLIDKNPFANPPPM